MFEKITSKVDEKLQFLDSIVEKIYVKRYYIAFIIFILCVLFEISGSSIGCWKDYFPSNVQDDGVIFGTSRPIRSDEWQVLTPMMFSQVLDGFHYFSNIIRGGGTDVSMVYGLPIANIIQIFRPFQLGFLILGMSKGLSFFWCGRFIALFMVNFEFLMFITKKNKLLSFTGSIMIVFAPIIQWWFAVNGIVEIFVFGELAILLLYKYMCTDKLKQRCLYLAGLVICAGGYIMVLYPAWQIPMFYVFFAMAIWVIIENRKEFKINYKDVISIIIALLIFVLLMGYIFYNSWDTIKSVMNTAYPGARCETGGQGFGYYVSYCMNIFLPYKISGIITNQCEMALMFGLFPVGIILTIYTFWKEKKKDILSILLLIVYVILSAYCIIGFPEILAKLTLLSKVTVGRAMLAVEVIDVLLLVRALTILEKPINRIISAVISIILSCGLVYLCEKYNKEYVNLFMCIIMVVICIYLIYFVLRYKAKYANCMFCSGMIIIMLISGARVNPIRKGVDVDYDSDIINSVQKITSEEEGKWITDNIDFSNYILMAGVPVINSINVYPNLERWQLIDVNKEYEEVYNRYAHIIMNITNDRKAEKFVLKSLDLFTVNIFPEELKLLDVKYIVSQRELEEFNTAEIIFEKLYNDYGYFIYKIQ